MKKQRVVVIGVGYIGMVHIGELRKLPNVELVGVVDKNQDLAKSIAERYGVVHYPDSESVLRDPAVDVIHNCTPNREHYPLNKAALLAGKEVLTEKPLALTAKESEELVRLAKEQKTRCAINFCYRYYPVVQEAKVRVAKGELGVIYNVLGHYLQDWLLYDTDYSWRLEPDLAGSSNILADLGSHWCDLAEFITGLKITEIFADFRTTLPFRKKPKDGTVLTFSKAETAGFEEVPISLEDYGSLLLRFENGARGTFTTSELAAGRKCDIEIEVYGSNASLAWRHERSSELWLGHRDKANELFFESPLLQNEKTRRFARLPSGHPMGYHDAIYNLFADFYSYLESKDNQNSTEFAFPDFEAGHREMLILEAALASKEKGIWVAVGS